MRDKAAAMIVARKAPNNHGRTAIVKFGPPFGFCALTLLAFAAFGTQSPPPSPPPLHPVQVRTARLLATRFSDQEIRTAALPTARPRSGAPLRMIDPALQDAIAMIGGRVWAASNFTGNRDGYHGIVVVDPNTGTASGLQLPQIDDAIDDLAVAANGDLWYASSQSELLVRMEPGGTRVGYPAKWKGSHPAQPQPDASGLVWFSERGRGKIGRLDPRSGNIVEFPQRRSLDSVGDIARASDGAIWFANPQDGAVGRLDPATHDITQRVLPDVGSTAAALAFDARGDLWFIDADRDRVDELVPNGPLLEYPLAPGARARCLFPARDGLVRICLARGFAVLDPANKNVGYFDAGRDFTPKAYAQDASGVVWFSTQAGIGRENAGPQNLLRLVPSYGGTDCSTEDTTVNGKFVHKTTCSDDSGDFDFGSVASAPDGSLWLGGYQKLARVMPGSTRLDHPPTQWSGGDVFDIVPAPHGLVWLVQPRQLTLCSNVGVIHRVIFPADDELPQGAAVARDGSLWLALPGRLMHVGSTGVIQIRVVADDGGPYGIALDGAGTVWFSAQHMVGRFSASNGAVESVELPRANAAPGAMAAAADGTVWFADGSGAIGHIDASGAITEYELPYGHAQPFAIAPAPGGHSVWFTDPYAMRVGHFDLTSAKFVVTSLATKAVLPIGVVADAKGAWVLDAHNAIFHQSL